MDLEPAIEAMRELKESSRDGISDLQQLHECADSVLCEVIETNIKNGYKLVQEYNDVVKWDE